MGKIEILTSNLSNAENNISIYDQEIAKITEKIDGILKVLKQNDPYNAELNSSISFYLSSGVTNLSSLDVSLLKIIPTNFDNELVDYSVTASDLTLQKTITVGGKQVKIYSSSKTDALYVISNGLNTNEKKTLTSALKGVLGNNQMSIVTYNNNYYKYDISNPNGCTRDYAVVGKTDNGKMYSFATTKSSELVVDNGGSNDTLITSINGMVLANRMLITMETNTKLNLRVRVKDNIDGGQTVTEFERLSFSSGVSKSAGGEYGSVYMEGDWQKYGFSKENKERGTWINENKNNLVVTVGAGPKGSYARKYKSIGKVDDKIIPIIIETGSRSGEQHIQGTVCYHHEGKRPGYMRKDMLSFSQKIVSNWSNI